MEKVILVPYPAAGIERKSFGLEGEPDPDSFFVWF